MSIESNLTVDSAGRSFESADMSDSLTMSFKISVFLEMI